MFDFSKGTIRYREYLSADMWSENLFKKLYFGGVGGNMSAKSLISWLKFETRYMIYGRGCEHQVEGELRLHENPLNCTIPSFPSRSVVIKTPCRIAISGKLFIAYGLNHHYPHMLYIFRKPSICPFLLQFLRNVHFPFPSFCC